MLAIIYTVMCSRGDVFTVRSVTPVHCLILLNPPLRDSRIVSYPIAVCLAFLILMDFSDSVMHSSGALSVRFGSVTLCVL